MGEVVERTLGKYQLVSLVARGGMAEVYKAYQPGLDRYVAVKLLHPHLAEEPNFIERFEREAASVARLRHPNIVQVIDFDRQDGRNYMVMEFVEGDSLTAELASHEERSEPYTLEQAAYVISGVASALDYAHERGMVHRDIKPGNILFTGEGQVVLADFGIAHIVGTTLYTESVGALGTPAYLSPEQGSGDMGDARSDIYSLGVVLYQILVGRLPFEADTPLGLIQQHIQAPLPPPRQLIPDMPEAVQAVILKALAKDPEERFESAGEMARALQNAVGFAAEQFTAAGTLARVYDTPEKIAISQKPLPPCPYRGLFAFREEDAPYFFGREVFTDELIAAVEGRSLIAVVGSSGSGKSSVVRAGLLPHLRQAASLRGDQGRAWLIADLRPGANPYYSLANALLPYLERELSKTDQLVETRKLAGALENGEVLLGDVIRQILHTSPEHGRILLFIDQFEELYTLDTSSGNSRNFVEALLGTLEDGSEMTLVMTLRADFLGEAFSLRPFADALQNADLKLGPMTQGELAQAIENPARKLGVVYEAGLVERILEDIGEEPGNLPLLEFALTQLWEEQKTGQLTHAAYEAIGRVQGALARYADQIFTDFDTSQQEQAHHIFTQLVRPGEGAVDTRRIAQRKELGEKNWHMVQKLADTRLVVTGTEAAAGQETVEVVHEALIQGWGQLQEWMREDRLFRTWQERLRAALHQWEAIQRDQGALLRGAPLTEAQGWLAEQKGKLSEKEIEFIQASVDLREQLHRERERRRQITLFALVGGLVIALILAFWANNQRMRATAAEKDALIQASIGLALRAESELSGISPERAVPLALEVLEDFPYTWQAERTLGNAVMANRLQLLLHHDEKINAALWSPDGARILTASDDNTAVIWDAASGETLHSLSGHTDDVTLASWSPDGELVITAGSDGTARLWKATTGEELFTLVPVEIEPGDDLVPITAAEFSPDGSSLATGSANGTVRIWNITELSDEIQLEDLHVISGSGNPVQGLTWSPDSSHLIRLVDEERVRILEKATGLESVVFHDASGDTRLRGEEAIWNSGSNRITISYKQKLKLESYIFVYRTSPDKGLELLFRLPTRNFFPLPLDMHLSSDGSRLATIGSHELIIWNAITGEEQFRLQGSFQTGAFDWSTDGTQFISGSPTGRITVLDAERGVQRLSIPGHQGMVTSLDWSPTGERILSGGTDGTARVWYVGEAPLSFRGPDDVMCADWSLQGDYIGTAYLDGTILVRDAVTGEVIIEIIDKMLEVEGMTGRLCRLSLSPEGRRVVIVGGAVPTLWDMRNAVRSVFLIGHSGIVDNVAWSPDGIHLATSSQDETIRIWDGDSGDGFLVIHTDLSDGIFDLNWSPDGKKIMLANIFEGEASIKVWDADLGELLREYHFEACIAQAAKFSPNGERVAAFCEDNSIRVWHAPFEEQPVIFGRNIFLTGQPAWSTSGERLLASSEDGILRMWEISTGEQLLNVDFGNTLEVMLPAVGKKMALISSNEGLVSVFPMWESLVELKELARECCFLRELTPDERSLFGLTER